MKYVIFQQIGGTMLIPVLIPECGTHSQVTLEGFEPVSAGTCVTESRIMVRAWGQAESLGLKSHPDDGSLLSSLLNNSGQYAFHQLEPREKCLKVGGV